MSDCLPRLNELFEKKKNAKIPILIDKIIIIEPIPKVQVYENYYQKNKCTKI